MNTIIGRQFPEKVIPLLDTAKNKIDIMVFDWRWYVTEPGSSCQLFNQAVARAARRGVKIRAIVNSDDIAAHLRAIGVDVKKFVSKHLLHCKLMILDDRLIVTGSHNYTQSAFTMNMELSVVLDELVDISDFNNFFLNIWQSQQYR